MNKSSETQQQLPVGWRSAKLGDVCRVVSGSTPSSHIPEFWNGDIAWITPTDLGKLNDKFITNSARLITKEGQRDCGAEIVPSGSVVLSSRAPIGHLGIATIPLCTNQGCKSFIPSENVDSTFLYYSLKRVVPALQALGSGAVFAEVSKSQLERFEIILPTLDEQKRIAALLQEKLSAVQKAREAAKEQLTAARALPASCLRQVFNNHGTETWQRRKLGELLQLRKEIIHPRNNPEGKAVFVGLEHIESGTGRRTGAIELNKENLTGRKPQFYKGDIVYGYLRPYLNKLWVAEFDGLCSVDQYVYSVNTEQADTNFIAWFMRSPEYLKKAPIDITPGQLPRIRTEEVAMVEISLPSLPEQQQIAERLTAQMQATEAARKHIEDELEAIERLPAKLLGRAFNGQL